MRIPSGNFADVILQRGVNWTFKYSSFEGQQGKHRFYLHSYLTTDG